MSGPDYALARHQLSRAAEDVQSLKEALQQIGALAYLMGRSSEPVRWQDLTSLIATHAEHWADNALAVQQSIEAAVKSLPELQR